MGLKIGGQVERINGKELSYKDFVDNYLVNNQPVVLTGLMDDWRACKDWGFQDGKPNLHFFSTHFGNSKVQVAECGKREFTDQKRVEMSVSNFIDHWLAMSTKDSTDLSNCQENDESLLYLKDWHFVKEYPEYVAYTTPLLFRDDWLNLYLNSYHMHTDPGTYQETNEISCSDYRFVYMGAKGTWTPLHADVFRSYSWSANVCGKKQWHFLSPSQCHLVFDRNLKNSVYNIFDDVSDVKFPGFKKAIWMECTQDRNEIIFVPSGWYHQVQNMEDTVSINHNWFNAQNLSYVWKLLLKDYNEAKEYIEDIRDICEDFESLCQRNLAANTGMNFSDFFSFMTRVALANIIQLYLNFKNTEKQLSSLSPSTQHLILNLLSIKKVSLSMKLVDTESSCSILDVREVLKDPLFLELCRDMEITYQMIYEHWTKCWDPIEHSRINFDELELVDSNLCKMCRSEHLIRLIDNVFSHFGVDSSIENSVLVSQLDELEVFCNDSVV
ncbi:Jmjc domain-containing protein [Thalictrum thalictroides]|uniref:Jmjc domain-containing protein n=1 Tax=Thalictrum thalictroides TaxID=46969 RepID=A0A7J6V9F2_THATH|nr:Jmjc domain-containing protein [Thalictrum thalictroides]